MHLHTHGLQDRDIPELIWRDIPLLYLDSTLSFIDTLSTELLKDRSPSRSGKVIMLSNNNYPTYVKLQSAIGCGGSPTLNIVDIN